MVGFICGGLEDTISSLLWSRQKIVATKVHINKFTSVMMTALGVKCGELFGACSSAYLSEIESLGNTKIALLSKAVLPIVTFFGANQHSLVPKWSSGNLLLHVIFLTFISHLECWHITL